MSFAVEIAGAFALLLTIRGIVSLAHAPDVEHTLERAVGQRAARARPRGPDGPVSDSSADCDGGIAIGEERGCARRDSAEVRSMPEELVRGRGPGSAGGHEPGDSERRRRRRWRRAGRLRV